MNTSAIADHLFENNEAITDIYLLNGHPVIYRRESIETLVIVGDTYSQRDTLKAHGYVWNRDRRVWEKALHADNEDSLKLELCFEKNAYVHLSLQLISMGSKRPIELELKLQLEALEDFRVSGFVEHD